MERGPRTLVTAAALVALVQLSACSQASHQRLADEVAHSIDHTKGTVREGELVVSLRVVRAPATTVMTQMRGTMAVVGVAVDATARRASLRGHVGDPIVLYDGATIFARRITKSPADRRLWFRVEPKQLRDRSTPSLDQLIRTAGPGDVVVVGPLFLSDLLAGVLIGSVHQRGVDVNGDRRITFNASIEKANRKNGASDADRKATKQMLRSMAIKGDIHRGEVVLRQDGSLASAKFVFAARPDKLSLVDLEATLLLAPLDAEAPKPDLIPPGREVTVRVPALGTLEAAVDEQLRTSAALGGNS